MQIVFEFVDGPLAGKSIIGDSQSKEDEAARLYRLTGQGAIGSQFRTFSDSHRQAVNEWLSGEITDLGGPYEQYQYEVMERSEGEGQVRVRARFVGGAGPIVDVPP